MTLLAAVMLLLLSTLLPVDRTGYGVPQAAAPGPSDIPPPPPELTEAATGALLEHGFDGTTNAGDLLVNGKVVAGSRRAFRNAPRRPVKCYTGGNAIEFLYAYQPIARNNLAKHRKLFERLIEQANAAVIASSNGRRSLRVITYRDRHGVCRPRIRAIQAKGHQLRNDATLAAPVRATGRRSKARKYVTFAPTRRYCGMAQVTADTRPDKWNRANGGPFYARVDANCWTPNTVLHEVTHVLGAVAPGAPHATQSFHCTDERDLMCYNDGSLRRNQRIVTRCTNYNWELRWDCGRDTYFTIGPKKGTWLWKNWNIARSSFLYGGGPAWPTKQKAKTPTGIQTIAYKKGILVRWKKAPDAATYGVQVSGTPWSRTLRGTQVLVPWKHAGKPAYVYASNPNGAAAARSFTLPRKPAASLFGKVLR